MYTYNLWRKKILIALLFFIRKINRVMISHEIPTANGDLQDFLKTVSVNIYDVCVYIYMFSRVDSRELRSNAGKIFFSRNRSQDGSNVFLVLKTLATLNSHTRHVSRIREDVWIRRVKAWSGKLLKN